MAQLRPADAAFEGLRLTRERPRALAAWAGVWLVATLLQPLLISTMAGEAMNDLARAQRSKPSPVEALELVAAAGPAILLSALIGLVAMTVVAAAVLRKLVRNKEGPPVRLGRDERVLFLSSLTIFVIMFLLTIVFGVVSELVASGGARPIAGLVDLAGLATMIFVLVRLSLAGPMSVAEGRVVVRRAWGATRGAFWPLLGAYVLAVALAAVVWLLGHVIFVCVAMIVFLPFGGFGEVRSMFSPNYADLEALFTPAKLSYYLFSAALGAQLAALLVAPGGFAWRVLARRNGDTA
jgi:MFS family permease